MGNLMLLIIGIAISVLGIVNIISWNRNTYYRCFFDYILFYNVLEYYDNGVY